MVMCNMERGKTMFAVVYTDEGPSGICGQAMSTTCPWTRVWLFSGEQEMHAFLKAKEPVKTGRKRARWTTVYPKGYSRCVDESFVEVVVAAGDVDCKAAFGTDTGLPPE
jgi:hypothetical protein